MNATQPYTLSKNFLIIRDQPRAVTHPLNELFHDSHAMFRMRVQHLGNVSQVTTDEESEVLKVMLSALIAAKKKIQSV